MKNETPTTEVTNQESETKPKEHNIKLTIETPKAEEEDDDDDDEETLQIFGNIDLELDKMDVQNLDKNLKLEPDPVLNDVEILG